MFCFLLLHIGVRIKPQNVLLTSGSKEHILLQHPHIEQTAIIAVPSDDFGQALHAFAVTSKPIQEEEIRHWLKPRIARYQMPQRIFIVNELPTLETGKVAKKKLSINIKKEYIKQPSGNSRNPA